MSIREFLRPARIAALVAAAVVVVVAGVLPAVGSQIACPGPCPEVPTAADGSTVADRFWFLHRDLGPQGSITVRMTSMTGTITYPPPGHDEIVAGLVPWAKAGIIVKDGLRPGSRYAALAMTGSHGVRFQHDYTHDTAGRPGGVSPESPRWLRLTRSGGTVTAAESTDGAQWHTVGSARLEGLPGTLQVGLFATSPGDMTLRKAGLGGATPESRFTQAVGVFDNVTVDGSTGDWVSSSVGDMNHTDWERFHIPSGAVQADGVITIAGTGDIGPISDDAPWTPSQSLHGLVIALAIVLIVAARYGGGGFRPGQAAAVGMATFVTGLVAAGAVVPISRAILRSKDITVQAVPLLTSARVMVGVAVALALCAVLAYGIGALLRRRWVAAGVAVLLVAVPYTAATLPLLPQTVADWLLRLTPAAGFAVKQTAAEYPQVTAYYAPSEGYFPLPWWAGLLVLSGYTAVFLYLASTRTAARRSQVTATSVRPA